MATEYNHASKLQFAQSNVDAIMGRTLLVVGLAALGLSHTSVYPVQVRLPIAAVSVASMCTALYYANTSINRLGVGTDLRHLPSNKIWKKHEKMPVMDRVHSMVERQEIPLQ